MDDRNLILSLKTIQCSSHGEVENVLGRFVIIIELVQCS